MAANETYENRLERVGRYSNCAIESAKAWLMGAKICYCRNRSGRIHMYWELNGHRFEFYARGRSDKTYLQNAIYKGFTKQIS